MEVPVTHPRTRLGARSTPAEADVVGVSLPWLDGAKFTANAGGAVVCRFPLCRKLSLVVECDGFSHDGARPRGCAAQPMDGGARLTGAAVSVMLDVRENIEGG